MSRRVVPVEKTIERSENFLKSLGIEYEVESLNIDNLNLFWISKIHFKNRDYGSIIFGGKGKTKEESLASLFGEVIERISLFEKAKEDEQIVVDLIENKEYKINPKYSNFSMDNTYWTASGNTYSEAILHAIYEVFEYSFSNENNQIYQNDNFIVKTEDMFPDWPQYVHDSFVIFVQKDRRFPVYAVKSVKYPNDEMPYMKYVKNDEEVIFAYKKVHENDLYNTSGFRIDSTIKESIPYAIGENIQKYREHDIDFSLPKNAKKKAQSEVKEISIEKEEVLESLDDELSFVLSSMIPSLNFIGAIDVTMEGSPLKVVRIITDFSRMQSLDHKEFLSKFFEV